MRRPSKNVFKAGDKLFAPKWLLDKVLSAALDGSYCHRDISVPRDHDYRHKIGCQVIEDFESRSSRKIHVENYAYRITLSHYRRKCCFVSEAGDKVSRIFKNHTQRVTHAGISVYYENFLFVRFFADLQIRYPLVTIFRNPQKSPLGLDFPQGDQRLVMSQMGQSSPDGPEMRLPPGHHRKRKSSAGPAMSRNVPKGDIAPALEMIGPSSEVASIQSNATPNLGEKPSIGKDEVLRFFSRLWGQKVPLQRIRRPHLVSAVTIR
jgi:hypothetical protein